MNKTKILVRFGDPQETHWLDTYATAAFPLTLQVSDLREISDRHSDFSKTIVLPATGNNNQIFKHISERSIANVFELNRKVECEVYADNVAILSGFLQLKTSMRLKDDEDYEIVIYGNNLDFFEKIGDLTIGDLNISHTRNVANIVASWSSDWTSGYVYPLIDYLGDMNHQGVGGIAYSSSRSEERRVGKECCR